MDFYNTDFYFSDLKTGDTLYMYIEYQNSFSGAANPELTTSISRALSNSGYGTKILKLTVEELKVKDVKEEVVQQRNKRILE